MIKLKSLTLRTNVLQSAMAGCTDLAFRLIARAHGLEFAFLEMVSANALVYKGAKTFEILRTVKKDKPLGVQLVGSNPVTMGAAAQILEDMGFDLIDINCGCPVPKIVYKGAGCALLSEPDKAKKVFASVVRHVKSIPVTVKMRSGFSDPTGKEAVLLASIAQDAGLSAVTVHGRTREQGYSGKADWGIIAKIKETIDIPVFGNGDIFSGPDACQMINATACDAVMVGRAGLGNPWIYSQVRAALKDVKLPNSPRLEEKKKIALKHFDYLIEFYGLVRGIKKFRSVACWYLKDLPGSSQWRRRINTIESENGMRKAIHDFNAS